MIGSEKSATNVSNNILVYLSTPLKTAVSVRTLALPAQVPVFQSKDYSLLYSADHFFSSSLKVSSEHKQSQNSYYYE